MAIRRELWTLEDDHLLMTSPLSAEELVERLGRTRAAIYLRRAFLGVRAPSHRTKVCKVCGAPRYALTDHALCETHYLEYFRVKSKESRQRKQVQA
jgi:hypothetical protein